MRLGRSVALVCIAIILISNARQCTSDGNFRFVSLVYSFSPHLPFATINSAILGPNLWQTSTAGAAIRVSTLCSKKSHRAQLCCHHVTTTTPIDDTPATRHYCHGDDPRASSFYFTIIIPFTSPASSALLTRNTLYIAHQNASLSAWELYHHNNGTHPIRRECIHVRNLFTAELSAPASSLTILSNDRYLHGSAVGPPTLLLFPSQMMIVAIDVHGNVQVVDGGTGSSVYTRDMQLPQQRQQWEQKSEQQQQQQNPCLIGNCYNNSEQDTSIPTIPNDTALHEFAYTIDMDLDGAMDIVIVWRALDEMWLLVHYGSGVPPTQWRDSVSLNVGLWPLGNDRVVAMQWVPYYELGTKKYVFFFFLTYAGTHTHIICTHAHTFSSLMSRFDACLLQIRTAHLDTKFRNPYYY